MDFQWKEKEQEEYIRFFQDLIRIDTTNPPGSERKAVEYLQSKLECEGIETDVIKSKIDRWNLIARIPGTNRAAKPIVLLSHLDVVEATGRWKYPPFEARLVDGVIVGRGCLDTKQLTAMEAMAMILIQRKGIQLERDLILIASADEERGSKWGMGYIQDNHPQLLAPAFVISEGGGFIVENEGRLYRLITAGEKGVYRFRLKAQGSGGHASCPPERQAIVSLNQAIEALCDYPQPERLCAVSQAFKRVAGEHVEDETLKNLWEYMTRSGFVFPEFFIGGAINVLPAEVEIEAEFRFVPGLSQGEVETMVTELLSEYSVAFETLSFHKGYLSSVASKELSRMEKSALKWGEEAPLLPILALGRTDGRFMNGDVYGFSPVLSDLPFSEVLKKVHGIDECISVDSLVFGLKVIYETITEIQELG